MIHDKNQIIRSMKSYEEGGSSIDCLPGKGCGHGKAQRKNKRQATMRNIKQGAGKAIGAVLGLGALGAGAYGAKRLLDKQKVGGSVSKKKK
jgi:hypothetical protein